MRRLLKVIAGLILGLIAVVAVALGIVYWKTGRMLHRTYAVAVVTPPFTSDPAAIARGRHVALTRGCLECHGRDLGGAKVVDNPAMGRLYGPNLTTGRGGRPATFADQDWVLAIRHGVAPDRRGLFLMPSADFSRFSDADLNDLIAYVKSAPPVDRDRVPLVIGPIARVLMLAGKIRLAADEIDHAGLRPDETVPGVTVAYGRYLAAGCTGCHGPNLSGGKIDIGPPDWPPAANLTPHASGRLARWSEQDFLNTVRTARRPDGSTLSPVMPRVIGEMSDIELKALWAYLRTLPPVATGVR